MEQRKRFLIIKPSSLGDIIHAFPAVSMLAEKYPGVPVDWVAVPAFTDIIKYHPAVDRVIPFRRSDFNKISEYPGVLTEFLRELRKEKYDAVIDLQGLFRSALMTFAARTDSSAGPLHPKEGTAKIFYSRKMNAGEVHTHAVLKNIRMMAEFLNVPVPEKPRFEMPEKPEISAKVRKMMAELHGFPVIAAAPGARWITKEWPPEFFAETLNAVHREKPEIAFMILGSPAEKEAAAKLESMIQGKVLNLAGKTSTAELVEAIRCSDALLCNDSGPMHIAAALNVPVTAMFGPTDPVLTGPFAENATVLQPGNLSCLTCFHRECADLKCQKAILPERAKEALLRTC